MNNNNIFISLYSFHYIHFIIISLSNYLSSFSSKTGFTTGEVGSIFKFDIDQGCSEQSTKMPKMISPVRQIPEHINQIGFQLSREYESLEMIALGILNH